MCLVMHFHECSILFSSLKEYRREKNFRQLNISYFKFTFGFNFHIVWYTHLHYSIAQKFRSEKFSTHANLQK